MSIAEEWDPSFGGRVVAGLLSLTIVGAPLALVRTVNLPDSDPSLRTTTTNTTRTSSVASPSTSAPPEATGPVSCEVVIIEAIFGDERLAEVQSRGQQVELAVEFYTQSERVAIAFVRYGSDAELNRVLSIAQASGWPDAYVSTLQEPNCEEGAT